MSDPKLQPATITKPMQLLAAWLVGLLSLDTCFLLAATRMPVGSTEVAALVWAAIVNVPIFLGALFLLQTKFRPELQEDLYYSTYINQKTNQKVSVTKDEQRLAIVLGRIEQVENLLKATTTSSASRENATVLSTISFGINEHFSDRNELSDKLLKMGIPRHTWFGGKESPSTRVVAVSVHLPTETRDLVLEAADKLGFTHYNLFDDQFEEIEEQVLIGSYGPGEKKIPRIATQLER